MKQGLVLGFAVLGLSIAVIGAGCEKSESTQRETLNNQNTNSMNTTNSMGSTTTTGQMASSTMPDVMVGGSMMMSSKTIPENAMKANNLKTLVAALQAANLTDTLKGSGPFTVFAPTDAAFNKVATSTRDDWFEDANDDNDKEDLTAVLTYHVVLGRYRVEDLKDGQMLKTVNGKELKVKREGNAVWIGDAKIETSNVPASNGIVHVVDTVLKP